jgi:hypothetical protein
MAQADPELKEKKAGEQALVRRKRPKNWNIEECEDFMKALALVR